MKMNTRKKLQKAMWRAMLLNFEFASEPSFTDEGGYWHPPTSEKPLKCHPLEAVLLGEESSGNWREDVAKALEVSPEWVEGFMRGWANQPVNDAETGMLDGTQARLFIDRLPFIWEQMEADEI